MYVFMYIDQMFKIFNRTKCLLLTEAPLKNTPKAVIVSNLLQFKTSVFYVNICYKCHLFL